MTRSERLSGNAVEQNGHVVSVAITWRSHAGQGTSGWYMEPMISVCPAPVNNKNQLKKPSPVFAISRARDNSGSGNASSTTSNRP